MTTPSKQTELILRHSPPVLRAPEMELTFWWRYVPCGYNINSGIFFDHTLIKTKTKTGLRNNNSVNLMKMSVFCAMNSIEDALAPSGIHPISNTYQKFDPAIGSLRYPLLYLTRKNFFLCTEIKHRDLIEWCANVHGTSTDSVGLFAPPGSQQAITDERPRRSLGAIYEYVPMCPAQILSQVCVRQMRKVHFPLCRVDNIHRSNKQPWAWCIVLNEYKVRRSF